MDINKLETFLTVATYGSFKSAAEHLFLSPRAVSKQMNQVEAEIGVKLFDRKNNRTALTSEGKDFIITARDIVNSYNNALTRIKTGNNNKSPEVLKIGFSSAYQATILQTYLQDFFEKYPKIKFKLQEESGKRLVSLIKDYSLDCIVTPYYKTSGSELTNTDLLHRIDIFTGQIYVGISRVNPLSQGSSIDLNSLKNLDALYYSPFGSTFLKRVFLNKFPGLINENNILPMSTMEQRNMLVAFNQGFGFYPSIIVDEAELENPLIKFLPISNHCNRFYSSSLWYNPKNPNPVLKKLIEYKKH